MLTLHASIPEIQQHIIDPIAEQVVRNLISNLGAEPTFGSNIYINSDHTTSTVTIDESHNLILPTGNKFVCEVVPNFEPRNSHYDTLTPNNIMLPICQDRMFDQYAVFHDSEIGVAVTEQTVPCNIELECTLQFGEKSAAYEFFTRLKTYAISAPSRFIPEVHYDYKIPDEVYTTLFNIYKLKYPSFNVQFISWLREWSGKQFSLKVNRSSPLSVAGLITQKKVLDVVTNLSFEATKPAPKITNRSPDGYTFKCTIVVQFARPNILWMHYPIIINNVLVPENILPRWVLQQHQRENVVHANRAIDAIFQTASVRGRGAVRLPWYDTWSLPVSAAPTQFNYKPFLIIVFTLDSKINPTYIDLMDDLSGVTIAQEVQEAILKNPTGALHLHNQFHVGVYGDGVQIGTNLLSLSDEGMLSVNCTNWNKIYRLVLSESKETAHGINITARVNIVDICVDTKATGT